MAFKADYIEVGYGMKWPTETLLLSLTADRELGEAEWWRRMAMLQNVAARTSDPLLLEALDAAKKSRWGSGFPQLDVTTPQNLVSSVTPASQQSSILLAGKQVSEECFKNCSEFVRQYVKSAVNDCYLGVDANLALIEIAFFDHNLLYKRNAHTAFVRALFSWQIITVEDEGALKSIVSSIADKHKRLPKEGYKLWSEDFINDRNVCENVGRILGPTIPYNR